MHCIRFKIANVSNLNCGRANSKSQHFRSIVLDYGIAIREMENERMLTCDSISLFILWFCTEIMEPLSATESLSAIPCGNDAKLAN